MTSLLDRAIRYLSPPSALRREQARRVLAYYEAARTDPQRKQRRSVGAANSDVSAAGASLREQARHLEQNHDLALGVLNVLTANIVGGSGIGIEPQPRTQAGAIHTRLAGQIRELIRDWSRCPEVTRQFDWPAAQRMLCRSWLRDGEALAQRLSGAVDYLDHGTRIPYSLELLEADFLRSDLDSDRPRIVQGIEFNGWGQPVKYHLHKAHPGESGRYSWRLPASGTKTVPAQRMLHLALRHRLHQARGVSVFAAVLSRLDDLKDYEESERIAAKVAASMAAFIRKGAPDQYGASQGEDGEPEPRDLRFRPGMVFDDLRPGEEIGTIDTSRPNTSLEAHRRGQLRAIAAGTYAGYSSLSKAYDGTYSAQRQELVEQWGIYAMLQSEFIGRIVRPVYEDLISVALSAGLLVIPRDVAPETLDDALYLAPQLPWIDPSKEAAAWERLERNGHASGPEIIRRRGQAPSDVIEQEKAWRRQWTEAGLLMGADPATDQPNPTSTSHA